MHRRRGVSTPALLLAVMMALLFIVLAVDLAQLSIQKHQMQIGADAASLTAAVEIMDQRWLYLGREGSDDTPEQKLERFAAIQQMQLMAALKEAEVLAAKKSVGGGPIALVGERDVTTGWIAHPEDHETPALEQGQDGSFNAMTVNVSSSAAAGNLVLLWMAQQTGLERLNVHVQSVAMVDTRLHGFRPLEHVRVPLVPLALYSDPKLIESNGSDGLPDQLWWAKGPRDDFEVDPINEMVYPGGDMIAEMVFRLSVEQEEDEQGEDEDEDDDEFTIRRCAAVKFLSEPKGESPHRNFPALALAGLGLDELALLNGQITLGDDPPAMLPADFRLQEQDVEFIKDGLLGIRGRPRIWPVAVDVPGAEIGVVGFVAGCVVDCFEEDGELIIVIQPCLLRTPTALTSAESLRNAWIGKLLLIR